LICQNILKNIVMYNLSMAIDKLYTNGIQNKVF